VKKFILAMGLALLFVLTVTSVMACGGGGGTPSITAQTQSQPQKTTGAVAATAQPQSGGNSSASGAGWSDMPIYPGAKENMKVKSDEDETINDKPAVYESRMYMTQDNKDKVVAFYKEKMAANGWEETDWTDTEAGDKGSSIGQYEKNGGDSGAVLQISDTGKGTLIKMDKKYAK
jgi:hypothetical protein